MSSRSDKIIRDYPDPIRQGYVELLPLSDARARHKQLLDFGSSSLTRLSPLERDSRGGSQSPGHLRLEAFPIGGGPACRCMGVPPGSRLRCVHGGKRRRSHGSSSSGYPASSCGRP